MVVFSNIYNHWIRDEFLNFENVIYDFFDPSGFDGAIVTAEAFLDISMLSPVYERVRRSGIPAVAIGGGYRGLPKRLLGRRNRYGAALRASDNGSQIQ